MFKHLIFDLDGTILNTLHDIHDCLDETLNRFNIPTVSIEQTKSFVGDGIKKLIEKSIEGKCDFSQEYELFFREIYNERLMDNTSIYEGMLPVLNLLLSNGFQMTVISNKSFDLTDKIIKKSGLDKYFLNWFGGDSFSEKKPSPLPALEVIYKNNFDIFKTLFIGDNYTDIECGFRTGAKTCFCTYGYGILGNIKPDYKIDSPEGLIKIMEG